MAKKSKISRRSLLKKAMAAGILLGDTPIHIILQALYRKEFGMALASESINPRTHFLITTHGAAHRWNYDLFLNPHNNTDVPDPALSGMGTRFTEPNSAGHMTKIAYKYIQKKGIWVPEMWGNSLPAPGGVTREIDDLLENMLHLRGIHTGNPSHNGSEENFSFPLSSKYSITSYAGDLYKSPLAAAGIKSPHYFRSQKGYLATMVSYSKSIQTLVNNFKQSNANMTEKNHTKETMASIENAINNMAKERSSQGSRVNQDMEDARSLFAREFGDLNARWDSLYGKYADLVNRTISSTFPGVNDHPVGEAVADRQKRYWVGDGIVCDHGDLRDIWALGGDYHNLAAVFALGEFLYTEKLTKTILMNTNVASVTKIVGEAKKSITNDWHNVGEMTSQMIAAISQRSHAACLSELISVLKTKNDFDDALIEVRQEFNRNPRKDFKGSDHAWKAASVCFYSGAIKGPLIFGNVYYDEPSTTHFSGYGNGASLDQFSSPLDLGYYLETFFHLARLPLLGGRPSLVQLGVDGKFTLANPECKEIKKA